MNQRPFRLLGAAVVLLSPAALGMAQDLPKHDSTLAATGAELYRQHCAMCHGARGKGDGAMAEKLHFVPADLTTLHRRTRGGLSLEATQRIIDGRNPLKGHGGPEMPVWGDALRTREDGYSQSRADKKIDCLAHYLASIQER